MYNIGPNEIERRFYRALARHLINEALEPRFISRTTDLDQMRLRLIEILAERSRGDAGS